MARAALLMIALSGCSIALQSKPSKGPTVASSCSSSGVLWKVDAIGVAAGVAGIVAGVVVGARDANDDWSTGNTIAGAGALVAVGYTASMGSGIRWTNECRAQTQPAVAISR